MTRGLGILWVAISVLSAVLPVGAGAADQLYGCPAGGVGDQIDRGFYIENFNALSITTVMLQYSTNGQVGNYDVTLTAHQGSYDGPVIQSGGTSFTEAGGMYYFDFQSVPLSSTMTIAFVQTLTSAPPDGVVYFNAGPCQLGDPDCVSCPGVFETEDTTPPLSTFRRVGVDVSIWGTALTPADQSTWGAMKSLFH